MRLDSGIGLVLVFAAMMAMARQSELVRARNRLDGSLLGRSSPPIFTLKCDFLFVSATLMIIGRSGGGEEEEEEEAE